ncbi:hypothetical protein LXJ58_29880, partial [Escherichia coli]|nr:hypothetical protein [Escherichia coli]
PGAPEWSIHEKERRIAIGITYLRNRFCNLNGRDWIESLERAVASAYAAGISTMEVLAMSSASDRAALKALMTRMSPDDARRPVLVDVLMRLFGMETELTVELFAGFHAYSERKAR